MIRFWDWVGIKRINWKRLTEAVEQQKARLLSILQTAFPNLTPTQHQQLLTIMSELEGQLSDPEDQRKSQTVTKFLRSFQTNPQDSAAHTIDRFKRELTAAVSKANSKGKTPEQMAEITRQELRKRLPDEPQEIIEGLLQQIQQGARLDDVVNKYLAQKNAIGAEDKVVAKEGNLELIEIKTWREDGTTDKHLDSKEIQACHPLFKGTKWCVRFQNYFNDYTSHGPLYLVREGGKPVVLGHKDSAWLDPEDEPPDPGVMAKVAPMIFRAGIEDISPKAVIYLPRPVEMGEQLIASGSAGPKFRVLVRQALYGVSAILGYESGIVKIESYDGLEDALRSLKNKGDNENEIKFDLSSIEEWVTDAAAEQRYETKDLVYNLDNKTEDLVINVINKHYDDGLLGEIEGWDDMDLEESLEYDQDLVDTLHMASTGAIRDGTMNNIIKSITEDLADGDGIGFYVNPQTWELCIKSSDVDKWIRGEVAPSGDTEEMAIIRYMNFKVPQPEVDLHFNDKVYNQYVREYIGENQ